MGCVLQLEKKVLVKFKFKDKNEIYEKRLTHAQYENLKKIELIDYCEIIE